MLPFLPIILIISTDVWVYLDERAQIERGTPVVFTFGTFRMDAPTDWVVACTFLWIIFFPLYLIGRRA